MSKADKKRVKQDVNRSHSHPLVRESRWLRVYRGKPSLEILSSKFLEDGLELKAKDFEKTWADLSPQEKLDLCAAYRAKPRISEDDEKILEVIMRNGDDVTWRNIVSVLARLTDRAKVSLFIRERIAKQSPPVSNFYQAIETLRDLQAVPQLRLRYEQYKKLGVSPTSTDRTLCIDYLSCCSALRKLTGSQQYERSMEPFLQANDKFVRYSAKRLLGSSSQES